MKNQKLEQLKPCPLCHERVQLAPTSLRDGCPCIKIVHGPFSRCTLSLIGEAKEELIAQWNKRTPIPVTLEYKIPVGVYRGDTLKEIIDWHPTYIQFWIETLGIVLDEEASAYWEVKKANFINKLTKKT